jgi:hypothetical protein
MRELVNVPLEAGHLPPDWIEEFRLMKFEEGALRTGAAALFRFPVPGDSWKRLRLEADVTMVSGALLELGDGLLTLKADLSKGSYAIGLCSRGTLAEASVAVEPSETYRVVYEFDHGKWRISVNERVVVEANDPTLRVLSGWLDLGFWADCLVHRLRLLGDTPEVSKKGEVQVKRSADFRLEVTVDFADDLLANAWTAETFDQVFAEFKSWGVERCHWIYYGTLDEGWLSSAVGAAENARVAWKNVGEFFPAAVRAAHANGIEIYGMVKPFDMGLYHTLGVSTSEGRERGKLSRVGGLVYWIADFAAQRRDLVMARKPGTWGVSECEAITRIDLVKENSLEASFDVDAISIYISDDNVRYERYEGSIRREEIIEPYPLWEDTPSGGRPSGESRPARVMRLSGLEIRSTYVVLSVPERQASFSNTFLNLVHVFGARGEERLLTYGVASRRTRFKAIPGATVSSPAPDFSRDGVEFDAYPGTPTAVYPYYDAIRSRHSLDAGEGIIGIALAKNQGAVAALSPSFPEVRAWWLSWVKSCLDAGADGIELRVRNHHNTFAWGELGFEPPVREEFLRRYGIDIWETDDFDRVAWRRLRGEGYTEFLREVKKMTASYQKPLGVHISPSEGVGPEIGAAMNIDWDWRTWIAENLVDSVTMKEVFPGSRLAQEILALTCPKGISTVLSLYANHLWSTPGGEDVSRRWIQVAMQQGYDGYQFYECASVIQAREDGSITMNQPALAEVFREIPREHERS